MVAIDRSNPAFLDKHVEVYPAIYHFSRTHNDLTFLNEIIPDPRYLFTLSLEDLPLTPTALSDSGLLFRSLQGITKKEY